MEIAFNIKLRDGSWTCEWWWIVLVVVIGGRVGWKSDNASGFNNAFCILIEDGLILSWCCCWSSVVDIGVLVVACVVVVKDWEALDCCCWSFVVNVGVLVVVVVEREERWDSRWNSKGKTSGNEGRSGCWGLERDWVPNYYLFVFQLVRSLLFILL